MVAGDKRLRKTEILRGLSVNALQLHAGLFFAVVGLRVIIKGTLKYVTVYRKI